MKRVFFLYIILCMCLASCCKEDHPPPSMKTEQTLFVYMPWSTNLTAYFERNIADIEKAIQEKGIENERILVYLMSSPTEIMVHGFPYDIIGNYLIGEVNYQAISDGFLEFYQNYTTMPCGTIGIIKCDELDNLASVMKEINQKYDFNPLLLDSVQPLDGYSPVIFFDFGDYVTKLCPDSLLLKRFNTQLNRTVPPQLRKNTPYYYTMSGDKKKINTFSGVTISDPSVNVKAAAKTSTAWYKATRYNN